MTDSEKKTEEKAEKVKRRIIAEAKRGHMGKVIITLHYSQHGIQDDIEYTLSGKLI